MESVRVGLPTEDLAMFLALHMDQDKDIVNYLNVYYNEISKVNKEYSLSDFIEDYSIAVMLTMFHPIGIVGVRMKIYDGHMIKRALNAYDSIVNKKSLLLETLMCANK